jgi:uncharacterized protein
MVQENTHIIQSFIIRRSVLPIFCFLIFCLCGVYCPSAQAKQIALQRPGEREFVRDLAGIIDDATESQIRQMCDQLLTDKATPILVITIESMAKYGGEDLRIETFATLLFDQWQIGVATINQQQWNTGILLLVSRDDRQARIELGAGWGRREDELCRQIMDEHIIYHFKQGQFSSGIAAGVNALDKMARKLEIPRPPRPWWHYAVVIAAIGLSIFTIVSLIRRGASGWAWVFWAAVFALAGTVIYSLLSAGSSGDSDGGYSGGSYGGGYSGGGGASGSW